MAKNSTFDPVAIEKSVLAEQVKLLYKALPYSVAANFFAGILIVAVQWSVIPHNTLLLWLTVFESIVLLRVLLYLKYINTKPIKNSTTWGNAFTLGAILSGLAWGSAGILMFPAGNDPYQMTLVFCLLGMSAGAVASHSFMKLPPYLFILITLTPLFFRFLFEQSDLGNIMAMILILCIAYLLLSAKRGCETTLENIQLRFQAIENEKLLMKSKQEAEHANRAKDEFLSCMSHELRTPLNAILGFGQILERSTPDPESQANIKEILEAGSHLLTLINEILDLSQIESGGVSLTIEDVDLNQLIIESMTLVKPMAIKRKILMQDKIKSNCNYLVRADRTKLKQVLLNLLSNAVKYNISGGRIELNCELIAPHRVQLSITDEGVGLTQEQQKRLFIPFERVGAEKSGIEGSGIGLVIAKRLIENMGGSIGVHSKVDFGSTFWIQVILSQYSSSVYPSENLSSEARVATEIDSLDPGKTILYIEDNPANLRLVEEIMKNQTFHTLISATNAGQGISLAQSNLPDLILMDLNLPEMSGYDALNKLKSIQATQHIPLVAISANVLQRDIEKVKHAGFDEFLAKPINIDKLITTINKVLDTIK